MEDFDKEKFEETFRTVLKEKVDPKPCWMCHDKGTIEEPVCGWCEEDVPHSSCDDTWHITVDCPACKQMIFPKYKTEWQKSQK